MKRFVLFSLVLISPPALADDFQGNIGGSSLNNGSTVVTGTFNYSHKEDGDRWQRYLDLGYIYNDTASVLIKNQFDSLAKLDYNLDEHNYLQAVTRYEYNELGKYKNKVVVGVGHGYRLIHNKKMKLSFETSVGMTEAKGLSEAVVRESIWSSYQITKKSHIDEKFLIEHGTHHDYIRNHLGIVYDISNHLNVSVTNIYINDYTITKLTTFNIGYKF